MPSTVPGVRTLSIAQEGFRRDVVKLFTYTARQVGTILTNAAGSDGTISQRSRNDVRRRAGEQVLRMFVGLDGHSPYASDGVTPLAEYPRLLNKWYVYTVVTTVRNHRNWLKRKVSPEMFSWLQRAQPPVKVSELIDPSIVLAQYRAMHTWQDPNGLVLSDRIWRTGINTRVKVDQFVADHIGEGMTAVDLSRYAEQFLVPGRAPIRTNKPYGSDASFDAMRLGRTEISFTFGQITLTAARLNPFVDRMDWRLSSAHGKLDVCDDNAAGSPYPLDNVPDFPAHPQDKCSLVPRVAANSAEIMQQLQDQMEAGDEPPLTPASDDSLLLWLLGSVLYQMYRQLFGVVA